jgi:hypothetical protein
MGLVNGIEKHMVFVKIIAKRVQYSNILTKS